MNITITTSAMVNISVNWTSRTEARMVCVRSLSTDILIEGGIDRVSFGNAAMILSTVAMTLAPGCLKITRKMPRLLSAQAACLESCGALMAVPTSLTRNAVPLRKAMTESFQSLELGS